MKTQPAATSVLWCEGSSGGVRLGQAVPAGSERLREPASNAKAVPSLTASLVKGAAVSETWPRSQVAPVGEAAREVEQRNEGARRRPRAAAAPARERVAAGHEATEREAHLRGGGGVS